MKFVKGVAVFLVLCLAACGAFTLFNRPQVNISERDFNYLEQELGVYVQDGQAAESGQSAIFGDVEGVAPVGGSTGTSSSSAPPSFLSEPGTTSIPPPFIEAVPRVAVASPEPESMRQPLDVFPPSNFAEPAEFPIQPLPFESPPLEPPAVEVPPVPATESPPPWEESWDGPASGISKMSPPPEPLQPPYLPPAPVIGAPSKGLPAAHDKIVYLPAEQNIRRIEFPSPIIDKTEQPTLTLAQEAEVAQCPSCGGVLSQSAYSGTAEMVPLAAHDTHNGLSTNLLESDWDSPGCFLVISDRGYSTSVSVPLDTFSMGSADVTTTDNLPLDPALRYTKTSDRQPLTFEPVKSATSPNAPVVTFAVPKRADPAQSPPEYLQQPATVHPAVKQIGTIRSLESPADPPVALSVALSPIRETVEQFIQSQRLLAESGNPENIRLAFVQLSRLYEHDQLGEAERIVMQPILDVLALRVIYAKESHILEPAYRVKPGESIESIAADFSLTPALLRKINGLTMYQELSAGTTLKVVYGQFDARISIKRKELTLLLGGLYAGRFSFEWHAAEVPVRGSELCVTHRTDRMIVLNNGWVLSTALTRNAAIVFAEKDAREIFDILSENSVIVVE